MLVISPKRLKEYWETRKGRGRAEQAERDLRTWHTIVAGADWIHFASIKQTFGKAVDQVGNRVVFNAGSNRLRIITRVFPRRGLQTGRVYILMVMDHEEYDVRPWREECGCDRPKPRKRR